MRTTARFMMATGAALLAAGALAPAAAAASVYPPTSPQATPPGQPVPSVQPGPPGAVPSVDGSTAPGGDAAGTGAARAGAGRAAAEEAPSRSGDRDEDGAVAGAGSGPSAGSLAYTGVEVGGVAAVGLGLLVAGGVLVRTSRRATA